jgi:PAS domain S-box-containing protein
MPKDTSTDQRGTTEPGMSALPKALPAELLDITFRRSPVPASLTRLADGVILDVNDAYLRHTAYERGQVIGHTAPELGLWANLDDRERIQRELVEQGAVPEAEYDLRTRGGEVRRVRAALELITLRGQVYELAMYQDITERVWMDAELRRSEERFELVGRSTTDAVYEWNVQTGMTRWNHGMRTLFGYPVDAEQPHNWWRQQVHPDDLARTIDVLEQALANGEQFWQCEYRYRRQDGSFAHVLDRGYIIYDADQKPARMVGAMIDITQRVQLVEAQARAALEERQRLARELHDSVTQSLYSLTLLAEAARRLAAAGDLERVEQHVGRLGDTAQQALKEMRLLVYQLRPLALEADGLAGALQHRLDAVEKRGGVQARLVVDGLVEVPASVEEALFRIAQEALNNSLKHSGAGAVTVTLCGGGGLVGLEIADNGQGFDLADTGRGGLGLTSMRERVEQLGGTWQLVSQPGQGTTVRVRLRTEAGP